MLDGKSIIAACLDHGCNFFTGVPDSVLGGFSQACMELPKTARHVVAANEGNAIALAVGWWLSRRTVPVVYLQNSGLGNSINPIVSLAHPAVYAVPMVLVVGWRGAPDGKDEPQHLVQGKITKDMLNLIGVRSIVLTLSHLVGDTIREATELARSSRSPIAVVVPKGLVAGNPNKAPASGRGLSRSEAIAMFVEEIPRQDAIVGSTGYISRDIYDQFLERGHSTKQLFLSVGSMGHASQIACGVALGDPRRRVWCLEGDGALLMHLGAMACIGTVAPENLIHVVLDNGVHASVGGSPTCAPGADFSGLSRALRYRNTMQADDLAALRAKIAQVQSSQGPTMLHIRINLNEHRILGRPAAHLRPIAEEFEHFLEA